MKIAIAETNGAIHQILRKEVACRGDVLVALGLADDFPALLGGDDVRVLILDWSLTEPAPADLCRRIRSRDLASPYLFVITVVGQDRPEDRAEAFRAGSDAVITLPCEPEELLARLDVARRISNREDDLRNRSLELEQLRLDLESQNATLAEIASRDALTGLKNRRYFHDSFELQFSLAVRAQLPISLMMIDVDDFKAFNDQFGHPAGDEVLREVSMILRSCVREHDVVARYGGEEFAILLPATDAEASLILAERLRQTIASQPWMLRPITISLGIATPDAAASQPADLIDQADRALYHSKALGRDRSTHTRDLRDSILQPVSINFGPRLSVADLLKGHGLGMTSDGVLPTGT